MNVFVLKVTSATSKKTGQIFYIARVLDLEARSASSACADIFINENTAKELEERLAVSSIDYPVAEVSASLDGRLTLNI